MFDFTVVGLVFYFICLCFDFAFCFGQVSVALCAFIGEFVCLICRCVDVARFGIVFI